MKKNRKGFMLAETIITTVVITTAMLSLFTIFNKLYTSYGQKSKYYNIDSIYAAKTTFNYLYNNNNFNKFINDIFHETRYKVVIDDSNCFYNSTNLNNSKVSIESTGEYTDKTFCDSIKKTYNVNKMVLIEYDKTTLENDILKDNDLNETFKDYIKFVTSYYDVSNNETKFSYLILTEVKYDADYQYGHIGIE